MIELSTTNRHNLYRLAKYLFSLPADYKNFGMRDYARPKIIEFPVSLGHVLNNHTTLCGTVACAIGHCVVVPVFKEIVNLCEVEGGYGFTALGERLFNCGAGDNDIGEFMFGANWSFSDDSPDGAAMRITMVLLTGCEFSQLMDAFPEDEYGDKPSDAVEPDYSSTYVEYTEERLDAWYETFREIQLEQILDELAECDSLNSGGPNTHEYAELSETRFDRATEIWEGRV